MRSTTGARAAPGHGTGSVTGSTRTASGASLEAPPRSTGPVALEVLRPGERPLPRVRFGFSAGRRPTLVVAVVDVGVGRPTGRGRSCRSPSSRSRSGTWCSGVAVVTRRPKTGRRRTSRTTATTAPTPACSGVPMAQPTRPPAPGWPWRGPSVAPPPTTLRDAEHRGEHAEPADDHAAAGLGDGRVAQQPQRDQQEAAPGRTSDRRTDRPPGGGGDAGADRADAAGPHARAEHDGQAEHGEPDAVAAVLGGERLGLVRAGDRAGQPAGAAGDSASRAADQPEPGRRPASSPGRGRPAGGALRRGPFAGRRGAGAATGRRPGRPAGRRAAGRHASDGNPAPAPRPGRRTDVSRTYRRAMSEQRPLPCGSWPTPITSELVVRAAARPGAVRGRRRESGGRSPVRARAAAPLWCAGPPTGRPPTSSRRRGTRGPGCTSTAAARGRWSAARCGSPSSPTSGCTGSTRRGRARSPSRRSRTCPPASGTPTCASDGDGVLAVRETHTASGAAADVRQRGRPGGRRRHAGGRWSPARTSSPTPGADPTASLAWLQLGPPGHAVGRSAARGPVAARRRGRGRRGAVGQPASRWCSRCGDADGSLWFLADRTDVWALYRWRPRRGAAGARARRGQRHRRPAVGVRAEPVRAAGRRPGGRGLRPGRRRPARRPRPPAASLRELDLP